MSLFERLLWRGAPGKARAGRLLAGAWTIFFAASLLPPDCLASPASAHPAERDVGVATTRAGVTTHASPTPKTDCCQEARAALLALDFRGIPSFEPPESKPPASVVRNPVFPLPRAIDPAARTGHQIAPRPAVPTYLLTLRLRA